MGFFGDMRSIKKIYGRLNTIEPLYTALERNLSIGNISELKRLAISIDAELKLLATEIEKAPDSVKCANFQFLGRNASLFIIIKGIYDTVQPCLMLR